MTSKHQIDIRHVYEIVKDQHAFTKGTLMSFTGQEHKWRVNTKPGETGVLIAWETAVWAVENEIAVPKIDRGAYQEIFQYLIDQHGLVLFGSELSDLMQIAKKTIKAERTNIKQIEEYAAKMGKEYSQADVFKEIAHEQGFMQGYLLADRMPGDIISKVQELLLQHTEIMYFQNGTSAPALAKSSILYLQDRFVAYEEYLLKNPGGTLREAFATHLVEEKQYIDDLIFNHVTARPDGDDVKTVIREILDEYRIHLFISPVAGEWHSMPFLPKPDWYGAVRTMRGNGQTYLKRATFHGFEAAEDLDALPAGWCIDNSWMDEIVIQWFEPFDAKKEPFRE